jgi:type II secretory ATPase GspE/PulE/Tfp pilus assembly ATPase PilB-like protein
VCPSCRTDYFPPEELLERVGWTGSNKKFVTGRGCVECYDSGLRGREGILELLSMSDDLASLILRDQSIQAINDFCVQSGMRTLKDEAFRLVEQQETSLEEVMRVVFVKDAQSQPLEMSGV